MGFPKGTRSADSVLTDRESQYYGEGFDKELFTEVVTRHRDGSRVLLTEQGVWEKSDDLAAVEDSRAAVRRMTGRTVRTEDVAEPSATEDPETSEQRFDRLTESLATVILRKISAASASVNGFAPFLKANTNPLTRRRWEPHRMDHVTDGLDVSTYGYDLKDIRGIGLFSGKDPVDRAQYDSMNERVKWLRGLEEAVSAIVLPELREGYRYIVESAPDFSLEIRFTDSGDCTLDVSSKGGRIQGSIG